MGTQCESESDRLSAKTKEAEATSIDSQEQERKEGQE